MRASASWRRRAFCPGLPHPQWWADAEKTHDLSLTEGAFLEAERLHAADLAGAAPLDAAAFEAWFQQLRDTGPGQHDPLFTYLAEQASLDEMRWFLRQEVAGEAGFEDLVALTQIRLPQRAKMELARNYWDEMGRGQTRAMHGPMLDVLRARFGLDDDDGQPVVWEALAVGNVLVGLAYNRRYAYQALGALGVVELTAPSRAVRVSEALERLGIERGAGRYFRVHAAIDIAHARTWQDEVITPLVAARPELARSIAEGAIMRLQAGARSFARYRRQFGLDMPAR